MNAANPDFKCNELTEESIRIFYRGYNMVFWNRFMSMQTRMAVDNLKYFSA